MCGIVGFSGPKEKGFNLDKIKLLLYWNQERGKDSLGYYTPEIGIIKDTGKAEEHMIKKDFNIPTSNLFIGHVRASTVGAVNKDNAHPFNYGNIILAMNGTLTNHWDLCREYNFPINDYNVDTQVLAAIINKTQNKEILSKILGACAIIYTDNTTGKVYCYRNIDRPLFRGMIDGCMYMSSIENSLKTIGCSDVKEFKADNLYEIHEGVIKNTYKVKRAIEKVVTPSNLIKEEWGVFRTINFHTTKALELVGLWLTPGEQSIGYLTPANYSLTKGYAYQILDVAPKSTYEVIVQNDLGDEIIVSKYMFKEKVPILCVGDYVFATDNLEYYNVKEGTFANKGDLLIITKKNKTTYSVKNLTNNLYSSVNDVFLRFAYQKEVTEFKALYYIEDDSEAANAETNLFTTNNIPLIENKPKFKTENDVYNDEVKATQFNTFEELVVFTINSLESELSDLKEIDLNKNISDKIMRLDMLLDNFNNKSLTGNLV